MPSSHQLYREVDPEHRREPGDADDGVPAAGLRVKQGFRPMLELTGQPNNGYSQRDERRYFYGRPNRKLSCCPTVVIHGSPPAAINLSPLTDGYRPAAQNPRMPIRSGGCVTTHPLSTPCHWI